MSLRGYLLPLLLALLVHAAVAAMLALNWAPAPDRQRQVIRPPIIQAQLLVMEAPAPAPRVDPQAQAREAERQAQARRAAEQQAAQRREAERQAAQRREAERREAAQREARRQEEQRLAAQRETQRREAERQAEAARQQRLRELDTSAFDQALAQETERLAGDAQAQAVQTYTAAIYQQVYRNWNRPPSARLGMQVVLRVELVPTGEVVSVSVVRSSGNAAFDRSAEQAVRGASPLEVPREPRLFEANFRRFEILFNPQDLLR